MVAFVGGWGVCKKEERFLMYKDFLKKNTSIYRIF